jgi:hypothetical protein
MLLTMAPAKRAVGGHIILASSFIPSPDSLTRPLAKPRSRSLRNVRPNGLETVTCSPSRKKAEQRW